MGNISANDSALQALKPANAGASYTVYLARSSVANQPWFFPIVERQPTSKHGTCTVFIIARAARAAITGPATT